MDDMQGVNGQDAQCRMQVHTHRANQTTYDKLPKHTTTQGEYDHSNAQDRDDKTIMDKVTSQNSHMKAWVYNITTHHNAQHSLIATQNRRQITGQTRPVYAVQEAPIRYPKTHADAREFIQEINPSRSDLIVENSRGRVKFRGPNQTFDLHQFALGRTVAAGQCRRHGSIGQGHGFRRRRRHQTRLTH
jgi:hypothetical protein